MSERIRRSWTGQRLWGRSRLDRANVWVTFICWYSRLGEGR